VRITKHDLSPSVLWQNPKVRLLTAVTLGKIEARFSTKASHTTMCHPTVRRTASGSGGHLQAHLQQRADRAGAGVVGATLDGGPAARRTTMAPKPAAHRRLHAVRHTLLARNPGLHAHPARGCAEARASTWRAETLTEAGLAVPRGLGDRPTACVARTGSGPLPLALDAEEDGLPRIGHACGPHLLAAMAAGAGIAAAAVADDVGLTVPVIGTSAEERSGGGTIVWRDRRACAGMHAAMLGQPRPTDDGTPGSLAHSSYAVRYPGQAAPAAAALTMAQVALGLLRQHIRTMDRGYGSMPKGGDAPNAIPAHTAATSAVRAPT
jgi:metal-dependent amidase/aminoacylase/carboxypeptidase family protein